MTRDPLTIVLAFGMFAGPFLQGLAGRSDPLAYVFAILISVALMRPPMGQDVAQVGRFLVGFLAIGFGALALWWVGGQAGPRALPEWLPVGVTVACVLAAMARRHLGPRA